MTIDEAIEILSDRGGLGARYDDDDLEAADNLGIEALKYIQYRDNCPGINTRLLLPGETEK